MKLKKIASLALAGIMAVSMLTACGEGSNEIVNPNPDPAPSTSDVVSAFENAAEAYTKATINVKESSMLNAYIDDLADKFTYQQLESNIETVVDRFESIFGVDEMSDLMDGKKPEKLTSTEWYYAIVDAKNVSDTTALIKSANMIADRLSNLEDAYLVDDQLHFDGEVIKPGHGHWNDDPMTGAVDVKVSYNATYTMYVHQVNVTKAGDTDVPVTVAILKVEPSQKV